MWGLEEKGGVDALFSIGELGTSSRSLSFYFSGPQDSESLAEKEVWGQVWLPDHLAQHGEASPVVRNGQMSSPPSKIGRCSWIQGTGDPLWEEAWDPEPQPLRC